MEIYVLDWILNKPILLNIQNSININPGDKILFSYNIGKNLYNSVGIYLGYSCYSKKEGKFIKVLKGKELEKFLLDNKEAKQIFKLFKEYFNKVYSEAIPVTARFSREKKYIYFYFYSEDPIDFSLFNKNFKGKIQYKYFLYQVGARDRVRLDERFDSICGSCGREKLCCKNYKCPIPQVESDLIELQGLNISNIDKYKGACGKLKCCLKYEYQYYQQERKKFPLIGEKIIYNDEVFTCSKINMLSQKITLIGEDNEIFDISIDDLNS